MSALQPGVNVHDQLHAHLKNLPTLQQLFVEDPTRATRDCLQLGPLTIDLSKQRLTQKIYQLLAELAEQKNLRAQIAAMFSGQQCNFSESRQVLHGLLRTPSEAVPENLQAARAAMAAVFARMQEMCTAIHSGRAAELGLVQPKTIVNIGIGGSDLGPRLVVDALSAARVAGISAAGAAELDVRFITNVDAHATEALLARLDPASTLFIVVSKSFATHETKLNAERARAWLEAYYSNAADQTDALQARKNTARHFLCVSSNVSAAQAFGIDPALVLAMSETVGGRYSLWSSVGLVIALAIGWPQFQALLDGAHFADLNYRDAEFAENISVRLAMTEYFNREVLGHASRCVVPYDDRLAKLADFLQQLEMESNGKCVAADGSAISHQTVPVVWGGVGTNVQHAFFQAIHQGTQVVPVDFIGVQHPDHDLQLHHQVLLANLLAQSAALLRGKAFAEAYAETQHSDPDTRDKIARQRVFPGNRPSTMFLLERITPYSLGVLLAVLENKTHALSVLWGVNAFDQWGVELGKVLANALLPAIQSGDRARAQEFDSSTQNLLKLLLPGVKSRGSGVADK